MVKSLNSNCINVAIGVIINANSQVLITRRAYHLDYGGLWEFPGGKIKLDETASQALEREIKEELNLNILNYESLLTVKHHYHDKNVQLFVYLVKSYRGRLILLESQLDYQWVNISDLKQYTFPQADVEIIDKLETINHLATISSKQV